MYLLCHWLLLSEMSLFCYVSAQITSKLFPLHHNLTCFPQSKIILIDAFRNFLCCSWESSTVISSWRTSCWTATAMWSSLTLDWARSFYPTKRLACYFFGQENRLLICIYAFSQEQRAYSFCGTIEYMAPEVVRGGSAGHDIVSFPAPCVRLAAELFCIFFYSRRPIWCAGRIFAAAYFYANLSIKKSNLSNALWIKIVFSNNFWILMIIASMKNLFFRDSSWLPFGENVIICCQQNAFQCWIYY